MRLGFTLIEMTVTVALCALIVGLITINMGFVNQLALQAELESLQTACMYAQCAAQMQDEQQHILFDSINHSYTCCGHLHKLPPHIRFGVVPGLQGPPADPHNMVTHPITFHEQTITCTSQGIMRSGTVYLKDISEHYQYALTAAVAHVSYLRKYRYDGTWQRI